MLGNIAVLAVVGILLAAAVWKIVRDKRKGNKCIGCPYSQGCTSQSQCTGQGDENDPHKPL